MNPDPEMDPPFERELRKVRPAQLDARTRQRWEQTLAEVAAPAVSNRKVINWHLWFPLAAAAGLVVLFVLQPDQQSEPAQPTARVKNTAATIAIPEVTPEIEAATDNVLRAAQVENRLLGAVDEGPVQMVNDVPFRPVRVQMLDTLTWEGTDGISRASYLAPREELFLVPVSTY